MGRSTAWRWIVLLPLFLWSAIGKSNDGEEESEVYFQKPGDVKVIKSADQFQHAVVDSPYIWMILFFSDQHPDKPYLRDLVKKFKDTATLTKGLFKIGVLDITQHEDTQTVAYNLGVKTLPEIYVFGEDKNNPRKYDAQMDQSLVTTLLEEASTVLEDRAAAMGIDIGGGLPGARKRSRKKRKAITTMLMVNETNFDQLVLENQFMVAVGFGTPWDKHSKKLKTEFEEATRFLIDEGAVVAWADCGQHKELCERFQINSYPTIKVFPFGPGKTDADAVEYTGERKSLLIVRHLLKEVEKVGYLKKIPELTSLQQMEAACGVDNDHCFIAALPHIFEGGAEVRNKYIQLLSKVAKEFREMGHTFMWIEANAQPELESSFQLTFGYPALVSFTREKMLYSVMHGSFSEKVIKSYVYGVQSGRQPPTKLEEMPHVRTTIPWDGNDAAPIDEEISLDEIMNEDIGIEEKSASGTPSPSSSDEL